MDGLSVVGVHDPWSSTLPHSPVVRSLPLDGSRSPNPRSLACSPCFMAALFPIYSCVAMPSAQSL